MSRNKVLDQFLRLSLHRRQRRRTLERALTSASNRQAHLGLRRERGRGDQHARPQPAAAVVHLGLGQVQRILSLDVARAHVVADRVPDNLAARADDQRELRLGHVPLRVLPNPHGLSMTAHAMRCGLEEELWTGRVVDAVVEVATARQLCLLHPGRAAPVVGDPGGPDLLRSDRRQQAREIRRPVNQSGVGNLPGHPAAQISAIDRRYPTSRPEA